MFFLFLSWPMIRRRDVQASRRLPEIHRQLDGIILFTTTTFRPIAFSSPVGFPSGLATSGLASRLPAARPLARGGVSVMAYFPVSSIGNHPFKFDN
jgi:hypothetical protein